MTGPLVSVLMPAYNADRYIRKAIGSIVNQTYENWELLICDDCSVDNTFSLINEFAAKEPRIIVLSNDTNHGELTTRNTLLDIASGELITFQDADDFSHPERLRLMVGQFEKNPALGILASQVAYINEQDTVLRISHKPLTYSEVRKAMGDRNVVGGAIMMVRRPALESVGGKFRTYFDGLPYLDYDLSLLIAEKFEGYSLPQVLYYYRQHDQASSKSVSIDRLVTKDVVTHLAKQRRERGQDDLMIGRPELVDALFEKLRQPYRSDPALVYRDYAGIYMYNSLYRNAIRVSWQAIRSNPLNLINWRVFQYCLRISIVKLLFGANRDNHIQ